MKRTLFLTLLLSFIFGILSSQVPQGFNYQAIARDGSGMPLTGQSLPARITIQADSLGTQIIWQEVHSSVTSNSFGLINFVVGRGSRQGSSTVASFSDIDWSVTPKFIKTEIYYTGSYKTMGVSRLWSVPYAVIAGDLAGSVKKLAVEGETSGLEETLFEVKNKDGQTVFAVYNEGVRVYVSDGAKAVKGGFSVGGFGTDKAESMKYLFVGKDSVRIYLDTNPLTKGVKSGFAVGGYDLSKGTVQNYLDISADSIRIYIDSNPEGKKTKGGFAVGGYDLNKGTEVDYLNIAADATGIIDPSENRILWYPLKNAFLTGRVLIESPDSVGLNSFSSGYESKAIGNWSQALGFMASSKGDYSTAIGKNARAYNLNSFAFGNNARALNEETYAVGSNSTATGKGSVAIGFNSNAAGWDAIAIGAGTQATGLGSFAVGFIGRDSSNVLTGSTTASQNYGVAIGMGAQSANTFPSNKGAFSIGIQTISDGNYSFALGYRTRSSGWYSLATGYGTLASGNFSTAMGYESIATGSHAVSIGQGATAGNWYAVALGLKTSAEGQQSTALGAETLASGNFSLAMGKLSKATGIGSVSIGYNNNASADYAISTGFETQASGNYSTSAGFRTVASGSYSLAAGEQAAASGVSAIALGSNVTANGDFSLAAGLQTRASGTASTATGMSSVASGSYSFAAGDQTLAGGSWSVAMGQNCKATTWNTFAMGAASTANGYIASAFGLMTKAKPFASFVIGQYNDSTCSAGGQTTWISTDPLFIAGNGSSSSERSNAMTLYKNGNLTIAGNLTQTSDIRLKENIVLLSGASSVIDKINPVYFYFKNDNTQAAGRQIGFIAQELQEVLPELVSEDSRGFLSVDYSKMSAVLLQAFKEQQKEISDVRSENKYLKAELENLQEKINRIEALLANSRE